VEVGFEAATELPVGEPGEASQRIDGEVGFEVGTNVGSGLGCSVGGLELKLQGFGILLLSTWAFHEDDELASDAEGGGTTVVVFDEIEREIDARRDACRGIDVSVTVEERLRIDVQSWKFAGDIFCEAPVGGDGRAIEEAGWREHVDAGADGGDAAGSCGPVLDPCGEGAVDSGFAEATAARNDKGVEGRAGCEGSGGFEGQTRFRRDALVCKADGEEFVAGGFVATVRRYTGGGECLHGTGYVKGGDSVEE